ncbi:HAD hydrolase-like protein [Candidatus Bipolaricaulota bacterium]|nr:HAD hydrolase-like protein [Candidatus Bipolaricaulota bacterium]MBS3791075.1 HAD hydrolase-like protein [Candidatus Bipolaricaulota bacterium]
MIKTITFDFGGVLYDYDGEILLERLASRSKGTLNDLKALLKESELDRAHFRGEIEAEELLNVLEDLVGLELNVEELASAYADSVQPKEEMFELVRELKVNYNLQLYSDTPKILYDRVITDMPIFELFSDVILSFRVGKLKDSPEGHREVIEKAGYSPGEIIFIDDRGEFVDQAKELDINGIKFTSINDLIEDFAGLGVKLDGKFDV